MSKKAPNKSFKGVKMTYERLGNTMFHQTLNILNQAEGLDLQAMGRIRTVFKAVMKEADKMSETYKETIQKPFEEKVKALGIDWKEGQNVPELDEAQTEAFTKIRDEHEKNIEEFGKTEVWVDCIPFGPQHLERVKSLSAARVESLGPLYDEDGKVRHVAFGGR